MKKRWVVNLTPDERATLEQLVRRERVSGLKRQRASILLKSAEGLTDEEIADELQVGLVTVERVRKRCCEQGWRRVWSENPRRLPLGRENWMEPPKRS